MKREDPKLCEFQGERCRVFVEGERKECVCYAEDHLEKEVMLRVLGVVPAKTLRVKWSNVEWESPTTDAKAKGRTAPNTLF